MNTSNLDKKQTPIKRRVQAVGPKLNLLLNGVFILFGLLSINAIYLVGIRVLESISGQVHQNYLYQMMFLGHLILGLLVTLPVILFGIVHLRNTRKRRNKRAKRVGYALFICALILLVSGFALTRIADVFELKDPMLRSLAYYLHIATPMLAIWLYVLHRLVGRPLRWRRGIAWTIAGLVCMVAMVMVHRTDAGSDTIANRETDHYLPAQVATLGSIRLDPKGLSNDAYCAECHEDIHADWEISAHRLSSFNNPVYSMSVMETREFLMAREGDVSASRFCAGCHDPLPLLSGAFEDPQFDPDTDPTSQAGITCSVCHGIEEVHSVVGNAAYTIGVPKQYPFAFSDLAALRWINRQLIKAKPDFHKKTFLKPVHRTSEFCGSCHKVHIPEELNGYKWLRGQNHYDTFLLSGVSGHGVSSFYYPPKAQDNCNGCHMPLTASTDFGADHFDDSGELKVHDHFFPGANSALAGLVGMDRANEALAKTKEILEGSLRVDIFGIREEGRIDGRHLAPLRPEVPTLEPAHRYLVEVVLRTLTLGHHFTQGTSDSNQIWLEAVARQGDRVIGISGSRDSQGVVDPGAFFLNTFMLDREGFRINRRNVQDIFVPLYSHQIPPGAAEVVYFELDVPEGDDTPIELEIKLNYRKFDMELMEKVFGEEAPKDLPIIEIASDRLSFPVSSGTPTSPEQTYPVASWQRWNDYGIGLLLKGRRGPLKQAEAAFLQVEELGRPDGPLNLARVYLQEGRVTDHVIKALDRAASFQPAPSPWTLLWFSGLAKLQNGRFEDALTDFEQIYEGGFAEAVDRNFDFRKDYRLLNQMGLAAYQRSKRERGSQEQKRAWLGLAQRWFEETLTLDPENLMAHFNLKLVFAELGDAKRAVIHEQDHARYKRDDQARDRAITQARERYPEADRAAEVVAIYPLNRDTQEAKAP